MKKRIIAWILLIGFILLLLNIVVFRVYWQLSVVVYILIAFTFVFSNGRINQTQYDEDKAEDESGKGNNDKDSRDDAGKEGNGNF